MYYDSAKVTYADAKAACASLGDGYRMAEFPSNSDRFEIMAWAKSNNHDEYWIGLNDGDGDDEGDWKWESGNDLEDNIGDWAGWKDNEPNNKNGENCAAAGCWTNWVCDIGCWRERAIMCQKDALTLIDDINFEEANLESGLHLYYTTKAMTYQQAKYQCEDMGARLADESDVEEVMDYMDDNTDWGTGYWIGLTRNLLQEEEAFEWESGSELSDNWPRWRDGQPNGGDCAEVGSHSNAKFVADNDCAAKKRLVCVN